MVAGVGGWSLFGFVIVVVSGWSLGCNGLECGRVYCTWGWSLGWVCGVRVVVTEVGRCLSLGGRWGRCWGLVGCVEWTCVWLVILYLCWSLGWVCGRWGGGSGL